MKKVGLVILALTLLLVLVMGSASTASAAKIQIPPSASVVILSATSNSIAFEYSWYKYPVTRYYLNVKAYGTGNTLPDIIGEESYSFKRSKTSYDWIETINTTSSYNRYEVTLQLYDKNNSPLKSVYATCVIPSP